MDESFISNGLELSDVSVDPTLRDKEAEKKIEDLKFLLEQEKRKITNFEFLIQRKRGNMNKLVNMEGDLEIMRTNLEKEKSILDDLDEKNREVERKVQLYEQNSEKGVRHNQRIFLDSTTISVILVYSCLKSILFFHL